MKKIILTLAIIGVLASCDKNDKTVHNTELIGDWKLIEVLADPGDGSGTFTAVESDKIISFKNNGIITSNGRLCDMSMNSDSPSSGTYSIADSTFTSPDCLDPEYSNYSFEHDRDILIINYPCIEPCRAKYKKQ
ncbi:lipocalin family protein [Albibacterium indicum]|uniref:lipocalin family protein n=1 Tax=Albibacterium indicum TaxID=2292082 RepID=UPI000E52204D|nr:lipocalin family protein [Pedobacter indicus]